MNEAKQERGRELELRDFFSKSLEELKTELLIKKQRRDKIGKAIKVLETRLGDAMNSFDQTEFERLMEKQSYMEKVTERLQQEIDIIIATARKRFDAALSED